MFEFFDERMSTFDYRPSSDKRTDMFYIAQLHYRWCYFALAIILICLATVGFIDSSRLQDKQWQENRNETACYNACREPCKKMHVESKYEGQILAYSMGASVALYAALWILAVWGWLQSRIMFNREVDPAVLKGLEEIESKVKDGHEMGYLTGDWVSPDVIKTVATRVSKKSIRILIPTTFLWTIDECPANVLYKKKGTRREMPFTDTNTSDRAFALTAQRKLAFIVGGVLVFFGIATVAVSLCMLIIVAGGVGIIMFAAPYQYTVWYGSLECPLVLQTQRIIEEAIQEGARSGSVDVYKIQQTTIDALSDRMPKITIYLPGPALYRFNCASKPPPEGY